MKKITAPKRKMTCIVLDKEVVEYLKIKKEYYLETYDDIIRKMLKVEKQRR